MALVHVFDLGDVLLFVNGQAFLDRLRQRCQPNASVERIFSEHYERARVDRGGDFAAVHRELVSSSGLTMDLDEFQMAWNDIFTPNPPMIEVVQQAPRPRFLLSNTNEPHAAWIRAHFPEVFPLFDHCVLSNEVGARKPDPAIYRHVESLSGQPPERHVFIDDVPEFVAGARAVGWHAIQFTGVEDCLRQLRALNEQAETW